MRIIFDDGSSMLYLFRRKLGEISPARSIEEFCASKGLGPDARAAEMEEFMKPLSGRRGRIKSVLMNQPVLSGLGNILSDEMLFREGVHPLRKTVLLDPVETGALYDSVRDVLEEGAVSGTEAFLLERRDGAVCRKCGGRTEKLRINGRSGYFCPAQQEI